MSVKERFFSGEKVYGTMIRNSRNPAICFLAKNAGLDYILLDCEHGSFDVETMNDIFSMAKALGLDAYLRAADLGKTSISRPLDMGAMGVMVPMTETRAQAEEIVKWSKYAPLGDRGYSVGVQTGFVKWASHEEAMDQVNRMVVSIAQIETRLAIDNIEDIASVEGLDVLMIGPNDLSISLGIPGQLTHPAEIEAIEKVAAACKKFSKGFGIHGPAALIEIFKDDIDFCMMQNDVDLMASALAQLNESMRSIVK